MLHNNEILKHILYAMVVLKIVQLPPSSFIQH